MKHYKVYSSHVARLFFLFFQFFSRALSALFPSLCWSCFLQQDIFFIVYLYHTPHPLCSPLLHYISHLSINQNKSLHVHLQRYPSSLYFLYNPKHHAFPTPFLLLLFPPFLFRTPRHTPADTFFSFFFFLFLFLFSPWPATKYSG